MKRSVLTALVVAISAGTLSFGTGDVAYAGGAKHCPPGLAKKGSCVPPGHRKHWKAGEYIPRDVSYRRIIWQDYDLPRPRSGHIYAEIGGDIYLLAEATQRVIEAINLVDAATR